MMRSDFHSYAARQADSVALPLLTIAGVLIGAFASSHRRQRRAERTGLGGKLLVSAAALRPSPLDIAATVKQSFRRDASPMAQQIKGVLTHDET